VPARRLDPAASARPAYDSCVAGALVPIVAATNSPWAELVAWIVVGFSAAAAVLLLGCAVVAAVRERHEREGAA